MSWLRISAINLGAMICILVPARSIRADLIDHDLQARCDQDQVNIKIRSNSCGRICDEEANGPVYGCKEEDGGSIITHIGSIASWTSWKCICTCYDGPDKGKSFPCDEGSCEDSEDVLGKLMDCYISAEGVLDTPCSELAGVTKFCMDEKADCYEKYEFECFEFGDAPPVNRSEESSFLDAGHTAGEDSGELLDPNTDNASREENGGSSNCSIGFRRARQSVVSGFVAIFLLALVMLRLRRYRQR